MATEECPLEQYGVGVDGKSPIGSHVQTGIRGSLSHLEESNGVRSDRTLIAKRILPQRNTDKRPLCKGDVVAVTERDVSLEISSTHATQEIMCAQWEEGREEERQWLVGWGLINVRVRERLDRGIVDGDILYASGDCDGTACSIGAEEIGQLPLEQFVRLSSRIFAILNHNQNVLMSKDHPPSTERTPGGYSVRLVSALQMPSVWKPYTLELTRRLKAQSDDLSVIKAMAERALAQSARLEKTMEEMRTRQTTVQQLPQQQQQQQQHGQSFTSSSLARPFATETSLEANGGSEDACSFCSRNDHDQDSCPSQVLVDLRKSGDMAPVRRPMRSPLPVSTLPPRVGSKRSTSESSLLSLDGRSMLTQSTPSLSTNVAPTSPQKQTPKRKKSIAQSTGGGSLRRSGHYMKLSDPRAKNIQSIIGMPSRSEISIVFPPTKDNLLSILSSARDDIPLIHVVFLAKTGRHTQEDVVSVLGCCGPNPIFKKMKLLFLYVPPLNSQVSSPTISVEINRLHPDHPSTLTIEEGNHEHKESTTFSLSSPSDEIFSVTLKPDHPRKVGGHSARFDVTVSVNDQRAVMWNVQVYNSRYGPRLVQERPERTPYSRPPAVCTLSQSQGMWKPGVAFLKQEVSDIVEPPTKLRKTETLDAMPMPEPPRLTTPVVGQSEEQRSVTAAAAAAATSSAVMSERQRLSGDADTVPHAATSSTSVSSRSRFAISNGGGGVGDVPPSSSHNSDAWSSQVVFSQPPSQMGSSESSSSNWRRAPLSRQRRMVSNNEFPSGDGPSGVINGTARNLDGREGREGREGRSSGGLQDAAAAAAAAFAANAPMAERYHSGGSDHSGGGNGRLGGSAGTGSGQRHGIGLIGLRSSHDNMPHAYPRLMFNPLSSFGDDSQCEGKTLEQPPP